jgi:Ion channel
MYKTILAFLHERKYELLLIALIQHLFIGIFLSDLPFYTKVVWPINMLILGAASVGVFIEKGHWKNLIQKILFLLVFALPIGLTFWGNNPYYFLFLNIGYVAFFLFIFWEVLKYLIKPSYINTDIISASACGYFLLIEISTFLLQFFAYQNSQSFKGIDFSNPASTYMDLVYFSSITLTSIGFGDITPNTHYTKLVTSFFGIAGQFYSVVLVGILISKFTSNNSK